MPVPTIWLSAPSSSHGQNAAVGHGTGSPVTAMTTTKKMIENGKPNRKRILVAPQVPSGPVRLRCIALRATWPSAAMMVKGIQSAAVLIMREGIGLAARKVRHRAGRSSPGQPPGLYKTPISARQPRTQCEHTASENLRRPLRDHHVVHVGVGREAPAVGERAG